MDYAAIVSKIVELVQSGKLDFNSLVSLASRGDADGITKALNDNSVDVKKDDVMSVLEMAKSAGITPEQIAQVKPDDITELLKGFGFGK